MRIVKIAVVLVTIAIAATLTRVQSQTTNAPPPMGYPHWREHSPEERMNKLSQELNLTDEQKTNVQAVFEQMRQSVKSAVAEARTNADTQLQQILTPEQYQKLQSMWQERKRHWGGMNTNETNEGTSTNGAGQ